MSEEGILDLPGLGPTLLKRLEHALGSREGVLQALDRSDVVSLSSVTGVSRRRAVQMIQAYKGEVTDWLRTDNAEALAQGAREVFLSRAITRMGRAQLETLAPTSQHDELEARIQQARAWFERLEGEDLDPVVKALAKVGHPKEPRPKPVREVTLLVEDPHLHERIQARGLDSWVEVATEADQAPMGGLVLAATMGQTPRGSIYVPPGEPHEMVPWRGMAWAEANRDLLGALATLHPLLDGQADHASPVLEVLEQVEVEHEEVDLQRTAHDVVEEANEAIEQALEELTLSGKDVLEVLQGGSSRKVEEVVAEERARARKRFEAATGMPSAPVTEAYPLSVDGAELQQLERQVQADRALDRFKAAQRVSRAVHEHREGVDAMVHAAVELDRWQAALRATRELDLCLPVLGDELAVEGALHLELAGQGDPVDYPVPNGVALLTGANSGGKTTLLETLGQVAYLTHLGLPVPARSATVPVLDGLAYYARPRQLGAGAFEGFLRTIEPVLLDRDHVLVLADELEAMTELEAASAIIAEVVARLKDRGCPTVLVTHLGPYILEHVQARVDGIEAKGLDEDNELLVDRTPKVGTVARSTPELILQRLRNQAEGERRGLYEAMLERLS